MRIATLGNTLTEVSSGRRAELLSRSQTVFVFDASMLVALCAAETIRIAGMSFHEWLGISLIAAFLIHVLLSWNWIAAQTRQALVLRMRRGLLGYLLNFGFYAVTAVTIFTGIIISEAALPALGIQTPPNDYWRETHALGANLM